MFDPSLFSAMDGLLPAPLQAVRMESMLIGIRNEHGDTYRMIGVTGLSSFISVVTVLHELGYVRQDVNACEIGLEFDAVITTPNKS
jgi:hypothetical protein